MKVQRVSHFLRGLSLVGALAAFPVGSTLADQPLDKSDHSGFVLVDEDIEKLNQKLLQQERELLEQLKASQPEEKAMLNTGSGAVRQPAPSADLIVVEQSLPPANALPKPEKVIADPASLSPKVNQMKSEQEKLEKKLTDHEKTLASLRRSKGSLQSKLSATEKRVNSLLQELEETRDKLLVAETEVERLSHLIQVRNIKMFGDDVNPRKVMSESLRVQQRNPLSGDPTVIEKSKGMPIVTVTSDKANLRTGPGTSNSPLMQIAKGTRLAVETRQGSWYRVIAPTGERAYIRSDMVRFGRSSNASPTDTVSIKGYDEKADSEAFGLIRSHSR